jgi:peptide/nickel transport system substrate-binding protein
MLRRRWQNQGAKMTELEYWTQEIKRGRASRREFMGRAAALGLTTGLTATILADVGLAQTPKRGGLARFGLAHGATTDTMDPAGYPDMGTQVPFWGSMSNSLTEVDAKGNITPDLCESMEPANGAKSWVFRLRKGVTFHNGKDLTPEDVIASFRYHMGGEIGPAAHHRDQGGRQRYRRLYPRWAERRLSLHRQ